MSYLVENVGIAIIAACLYVIPAFIAWRLFLVMLRQVVAIVRAPAESVTVVDDSMLLP